MPTGYTAGIIDGKITTFEQFAKTCMRAMGACIHMRDEPNDAEYTPAVPSDYYESNLIHHTKQLERIKVISDEDLLAEEVLKIETRISEMKKAVEEKNQTRKVLEKFFNQAVNYTPPTKDHEGVRKLMIDQLRITIDHDGDSSYYEKELVESEAKLKTIDVKEVREYRLKHHEEEIEYYTKEHNQYVERCNERNEWVRVFLESIKNN